METKTYQQLITFETYEERLKYLRVNGKVGIDTFGYDRVFNQMFYHSAEWQNVRDYVIVRDHGWDLAVPNMDICYTYYDPKQKRNIEVGTIYIHHIVPITMTDIEEGSDRLFNPNNLICCSFQTHQAIHYGSEPHFNREPTIRTPNDTCPWKKGGT